MSPEPIVDESYRLLGEREPVRAGDEVWAFEAEGTWDWFPMWGGGYAVGARRIRRPISAVERLGDLV